MHWKWFHHYLYNIPVSHRFNDDRFVLFNRYFSRCFRGVVHSEHIVAIDSNRGYPVCSPSPGNSIASVLLMSWGWNSIPIVPAESRNYAHCVVFRLLRANKETSIFFCTYSRVSSDRENWEDRKLAGKLNDPGKNREMAGKLNDPGKNREMAGKLNDPRKNREIAGKLNDPVKNREMAGNFAKRRKVREFCPMILFFKKKNCGVRFCLFFRGKSLTIFCFTLNNLQNTSPKLYFLVGGCKD